MELFGEILKYTIPAIIVFFTTYFLVGMFLKNDEKRRRLQLALDNQKLMTPIRLQAYERMIMFLERINPDALIMRLNRPGMSAKQLQSDMLKLIRAEFEHNLSQQIYVSEDAWRIVRTAMENTIQFINAFSGKISPTDPAIKLSKLMIESYADMNSQPIKMAIKFIKKEISNSFQ